MSIEDLISTYGYAAVAIGSFLEGETVVVLGGFSAHRGYLELPWVIVAAFLGSFIGDQFYFYIGRARGAQFLEKRPHWQRKSEKVFTLLNQHQNWLMLGFRFLYGLRTVTPFLVGAAKISPLKFLVFNFLGATVWAVAIGAMGFYFGHAFELILGDLKHYELLLFGVLAGLGLAIWIRQLLKRRQSR